jgi:hypothetical protein
LGADTNIATQILNRIGATERRGFIGPLGFLI